MADMPTGHHKWLDMIEHIWPLLSGIGITILAAVKLWWNERQQTKKRIETLEVMCEHMVSKDELQACRDDVRETDLRETEKIYDAIEKNSAENNRQHQEIMKTILELHSK